MRTDDGYIIHKCLNGEPESFGVLVDKYKEGIYAYTYTKLQDWQDAQDVTQETFIQAYRKLHTLKRWDSFAGWLYRIAANFCKNWKSSKSKRPDLDFIDDQKPAMIDKPSIDYYRENEMVESVHEALNSLSETYREVLTLYYFGGMDSNKIAEVLNTSPLAIRIRLSRARAQLREEMFNMISVTFEQQKLRSGFTFKIVEAIKRIKIHPTSQIKGIPWGVSLATGLIFTILSFNSHFNPIVIFNSLGGSFLPSESKVLKVGEIPMNITNISNVTFLSSQEGNGNSSDKSPNQNTFFMAPKAEIGKWVNKADMPTAREFIGACVLNGKIVTFGGADKSGALKTVEIYDPATDKWTKGKDMPTAKDASEICVVNGKVYMITDYFNNTPVVEYDPLTDTWTKKADLLTPRALSAACTMNGLIYVFGGTQGANVVKPPAVEVYDPSKDEWTRKKDMPVAREGSSSSVVKDKIYVIGGFSDVFGFMSRVEEYDPVTDEWKDKSPMPTGRCYFSSCVVDNKIYVIGGVKNWGLVGIPTVEVYEPITDTWEKKADITTARCRFSTVEVDGRIFVIGGNPIFSDPFPNDPLASVEEYDTGFRPSQVIQSKGKIPTTWGEKKK